MLRRTPVASSHSFSSPSPAPLPALKPAVVFKCTKGEEADSANAVVAEEPEAPPKPAPWVPCESFKGPECEAHKECALCTVDTPKRKEKGKLPKEM